MFDQLTRDQVAQHVQILGWVVLATGVLSLIGSACLWVALSAPALAIPEAEPRLILPVFAFGIAGFVAVLSCISIAAGYGMLTHRRWGRVLGLIDGFLGLIWFPVGTILGLYAFWVLFQAEAIPLFEGTPEAGDREADVTTMTGGPGEPAKPS
jgi:hypothetical protein